MNIEQRAHEAAMAHAASVGPTASDDFASAYQYVYQAVVSAAGNEKTLIDAAYLEMLYQQGRRQANNLDIALNDQLRSDNMLLNIRARVAEHDKAAAQVGNVCNMAVCAMGGFAVAMILVWLK